MIKGDTVELHSPTENGVDSMGEPIIAWEVSYIENVLFQPAQSGTTGTSDLDADRPNGVEIHPTFHFPKTFTGSLRGCNIVYNGHIYRVIGDPQPYMEENTPGEWNRTVPCEAVYG